MTKASLQLTGPIFVMSVETLEPGAVYYVELVYANRRTNDLQLRTSRPLLGCGS
jgi:hypothetical protein